MTPAETYHTMTDEELVAFVAANLPKIVDRITYKPRCWLCKDSIIDEIRRQQTGEPALPYGGSAWTG